MADKPTGVRVNNPPGGATSNIFNTSDEPNQPRKVKDHQKSSIFGTDQADGPKRNFLSPRYQENTKQRLFGEVGGESGNSPRRINDTWRSNVVFSASADCLSDEANKRTPRRSPSAGINPVTGELLLTSPQHENGGSPHMNGVVNGTEDDDSMTNGKINGQNGQNGQPNGNMERKIQNGRQPPGGKASGIF